MSDSLPAMVQPSAWSTTLFVAIVATLCVLFVLALVRAFGDRQTRAMVAGSLGLGAWLGVTAAVADGGLLAPGPTPPPLMIFFAVCNALAVALALSGIGRRIADHVPVAALVGFQAFRLPLELVLHQWYREGVIPVQMTFAGHNFDIVTGILAVVVGLLVRKGRAGRAVIALFNLVGLALLLNVASIAVRSSPVPLRTYLDAPVLQLGLHSPFVWIVPICVGGALFGHVVVFRWLWRTRA